MEIEESYNRIFWFFDRWVIVMEFHTRIMEIQDSHISSHKILILSPPTDRGIQILSKTNSNGETYLMCFSERLAKIAKDYSFKNGIENLNIFIERFFNLPFKDGYFDAVFANCFFDFCQKIDFDKIICEIKRILKKEGHFYSVYMNLPSKFFDHIWTILFKITPYLRKSVFPVDIKDVLLQTGFQVEKDIMARRFGFPLKYIMAIK
jgi:ubiquinone/menaquinone biosynthesis C-methylase UbiE